MDSIRRRTVPLLLLASLLGTLGYAQEPASPNSSPNASTKQSSSDADRVVLKVGDIQVTKEEFESRIRDVEGHADESAPDKDRQRLGDDYASVLMLSQQAVAKHLDSSPEVARQLAIARMQVLSDAEFASLMQQAQPTFAEVSQYYSAHLADYDEVRIRRLFVWKKRDNAKDAPVLSSPAVKARSEQIRQTLAAGTSEKRVSADLSKSGEGMLDAEPVSFPRGELSAHMEKVAFGLEEGEWGEVEDTPARLLLIQLVRRDRQQLGEVSSAIEQELHGQKMQALLDDSEKESRYLDGPAVFWDCGGSCPGRAAAIFQPTVGASKISQKRGKQ